MPSIAKRPHKSETPFVVELCPIQQVRPYEKNPRLIPPEAIEAVANSIETFGFRQPIVVDEHGVIIVGHTRYRAALKLGIDKVPVHVARGLSAEQVQAYRIADNSTNTLSDWDLDMLNLELSDLPSFDFTDFGLDLEAVRPQPHASDDDFDLDAVVASIKEPQSKLGDVWLLGRHRLLCGDSTVPACVERLMDGRLADCVWTDPPYNVEYEGKTKDKLTISNDSFASPIEFRQFLHEAFTAIFGVTKPGGSIYVSHADSEGYNFRGALTGAGWMLKQCLIWAKNSMVMGRQDYHWQHEPILYGWKPGAAHKWYADRTQTTLLQFDRPTRSPDHPTMKPVGLVGYCLGNSSKRGNIVLDGFGGSGTTMVACEQIDREARMLELDPVYCDVIVQRWERLTGGKATR
jgi:DNA modification methylase